MWCGWSFSWQPVHWVRSACGCSLTWVSWSLASSSSRSLLKVGELGMAPFVHARAGKTKAQLAGGVILGVALWLRHDPQTTNLLYLELGDKPAPNTFYVGIYILIAVGAVMMFVGFLGCYGAIQESQCLLGTFFTCLVILFACEVAAGIWGFVNKDQIAKDVKQFYDQALQQAVVDDDANNAKAVVKTFHETLDCCGSSTLTALTTSVLKNNLCPSGSNIISNLFKEDCHQKIDDLFSGKLYLIGIAAIVVAVIMIFEMILSMVLCCGIRNSSVY
ncbi:CD81 molecule [Homo sapiens]|uniref:CD81 antigen n=1 Tax=Homo sapiens TaxID=9606 RepID=A6NMH8_HUMAN|nr:CD81 antigen isoform X5 [Homo sapiens]KAI2558131.1 CD81 molecule [Homo sapiens]KAI4069474.1 CD81 molecule [Homo sapiens]